MGNEKGLTGEAHRWLQHKAAGPSVVHRRMMTEEVARVTLCLLVIDTTWSEVYDYDEIASQLDVTDCELCERNQRITDREVLAEAAHERTALVRTLRATADTLALVLASPPATRLERLTADAIRDAAFALLEKVGAT
jgi:hypothetical protein